nr:hypothetical protein [Anaerolineae bacterium]
MPNHNISRKLVAASLIVVIALAFSACNLGPAVPSEPTSEAPSTLIPQTDGGNGGELAVTPSATTPSIIQPTPTDIPDLLPAETLGPITVDGDSHRTQEDITIRVRKGTSVSNVTCSWVHQDTGQSGAISEIGENILDATASEKLFTFTPQMAGTYTISCTGVAITIAGQRAVSSVALPFSVEAKG